MTGDVNECDDAALDRLLARVPAPAVPAALERRILADFDRVDASRRAARASGPFGGLARALADAVWPGGPMWQPLCAFAVALLIGLGVAAFAPFDIPQDDAGSVAFALDGSPDVDAGQGI